MASGRPRHGLGPSGELTGGGGEGITCSPGISRAPALASQTSSGSHPRSASRCLPKKSAQRFPARQGVQPAKGPLLQGTGVRPGPARDLSPRAPAVSAAAHLAPPGREGRAPGSGVAPRLRWAALPTPGPAPGVALARSLARSLSRSAALLRGASAAAGWRLCGRRAGRALSFPGRSEAAAVAAGGGFLRCGPSRSPRTSAARTPAPSPPPPRAGRTLGSREGLWARGRTPRHTAQPSGHRP